MEEKNQKVHPSLYGTWKKIGIDGIQKPIPASPIPDIPGEIPVSANEEDDDLKKLDRILQENGSSNEGRERTYEQDSTLEALDAMISDIRKKGSSSSEEAPGQDQSPETPYKDIISLLGEDERIDLEKIEQELFGKKKKQSDDTIEGIEEEYLKALEQRYEKEQGGR